MRLHKKTILTIALLAATAVTAQDAAAQRGRNSRRQPAPRKAAPAPRRTSPAPAPLQRRGGSTDTTLRTTTLEILQVYRPQVRRAPRPQFNPAPPPPDTARAPQTYEVPQQALYYTYRSLPLRPLALGTDTAKQPPKNFIRLGGGNQSTAYAEIGIGGIGGPGWSTAITGKHLSQTGDYNGQQSSLSDLQLLGSWNGPGDHRVHAGLSGVHNRYSFFGFDNALYGYDLDTLKQAFTGIRFTADVAPSRGGKWFYKPAVTGSIYSDKWDAAERAVGFDLPVSRALDSVLSFTLGVNGSFISYKQDTVSAANNLLQIRPSADIRKGQILAHIGITPSFGTTETTLLPDFSLTWTPGAAIAFAAGWKGTINQNTYESLTTRNPWINNRQYTPVQNRNIEAWAQVSTAFADYFKVRVRAGLWELTGLPMFVNTLPDGKRFGVEYGNFRAASVSGDVRYAIGETFSVGGSGEWYHYYAGSSERPWHEPSVRLRGDIQVHPAPGLRITGYIHALDGIYAPDAAGAAVKLPVYVDLGAGADYVLIRQVALFLRATNLLSRRNERWQGYPSYKLGVYGGVSVRFK